MTAALVVIAVVALVAIVALVVTARRAGAMVAKERARADGLEARVQGLEEAAAASGAGPAKAAPAPPVDVTRSEAATPAPADEPEAAPDPEPDTPVGGEEPAPAAELAVAEPAAAEPAAGESPATTDPDPDPDPDPAAPATPVAADEPADPAAPAARADPEPAPTVPPAERAGTNSHGGVAAKPLLELERLRLEREWADIVGTATPLPVPWDGSVRGVVAVELDIIREVIGTPSHIEPAATSRAAEPAFAVATARLATEILRRLAKAGEEISVTFVTDTDVTMAIAVEGNEVKPDLSDLTTTAAELGGRLTLIETDEGFEAQLRVPSPPT